MQIYLPIAEMSVNIFLLIGLGGVVGILSGMFGVGGGFLMTPLLFFIGIPPAIAVASEANQILGASTSGAIAHFRRRNVDIKMGFLLVLGGIIGSAFGVEILTENNNIKEYSIRHMQRTSADIFELVVPEGSYFGVGDNRDNSNDSRSWGFIKEESIWGRADFIWLSWKSGEWPNFSRAGKVK